jgi:hypothetical protein
MLVGPPHGCVAAPQLVGAPVPGVTFTTNGCGGGPPNAGLLPQMFTGVTGTIIGGAKGDTCTKKESVRTQPAALVTVT